MKDVFKNHKVGDKVWNLQTKKWETIEKIIKDSNYPIHTQYSTYKKDGRARDNAMIATIYPNEFGLVIPDEAYVKPKPKLAINTKVIVWKKGEDNRKHNRYFNQFDIDGRAVCYPEGTTSFTRNATCRPFEVWDNYEIYKEKENEQ